MCVLSLIKFVDYFDYFGQDVNKAHKMRSRKSLELPPDYLTKPDTLIKTSR